MKILKLCILSILLIFFFTTQVSATWCQGKPLPEQESFSIFETSWKSRIVGTNVRAGKSKFLLTLESGYMKNISPKKSIGGTFYISADDDGSSFGVKFRYRHWFNKKNALDLSPGLILTYKNDRFKIKTPGFVSTASLGVRDLIAIEVQFQAIRGTNYYDAIYYPSSQSYESGKSQTQTSWYVGARFGSYMAIVSTVVLVGIAVIFSGNNNYSGFNTY